MKYTRVDVDHVLVWDPVSGSCEVFKRVDQAEARRVTAQAEAVAEGVNAAMVQPALPDVPLNGHAPQQLALTAAGKKERRIWNRRNRTNIEVHQAQTLKHIERLAGISAEQLVLRVHGAQASSVERQYMAYDLKQILARGEAREKDGGYYTEGWFNEGGK